MRPFSLLVKPASADCNLNCPYCFYLDRSSMYPQETPHRMSDYVLERMISSYMATEQPNYAFGWQGGEPTLMGAGFFRKVTELQKKHGRRGSLVSNGLQTNGTMITDQLATHMAEYRFLVGVSIDGPAAIHDAYRVDQAGAGTHARVMEGIETLRRHRVDFNTLTLVTQANVRRAREVYEWLVGQGFLYQQYIPCVEFGRDGRLAGFAVDGESWGRFLRELFDAWYESDTQRVSIRLFDSILHKLVDGRDVVCHTGHDCRQYFVVEHNGDIYPCDFFVRPDFLLGNVSSTTWQAAQESDAYRAFGRAKSEWNPKCGTCMWTRLCAGDCMKHRPGAPTSPGALSVLCEGQERFFEHASSRIEDLAVSARACRRREDAYAGIPAPAAGRNDRCPCGSGLKFKKCCGRPAVR